MTDHQGMTVAQARREPAREARASRPVAVVVEAVDARVVAAFTVLISLGGAAGVSLVLDPPAGPLLVLGLLLATAVVALTQICGRLDEESGRERRRR